MNEMQTGTSKQSETVSNNEKVFQDPVHGCISLPDYCVEIIDTPEFQRLRNIKQLTAESVYPGATHNRFSHSIGVCHIAGRVLNHLKEKQPSLKITPEEVKCVQLAGLCHDLGHGPLSHKFEDVVNRLLPGKKWKHEDVSVKMLHHLNKENRLGLTKEELHLISDLIIGEPQDKTRQDHYEKKHFLYQIVANKDSGVDVDKWDYFTRDCHYLGIPNSFDYNRIIPCMRVYKCDKYSEICFRDKLVRDLNKMFAVRWDLHYGAYQHRVVKLSEQMYADALHVFFTEEAKKEPEDAEFGALEKFVYDDMSKYSLLDDHIIGSIRRSKCPELKPAREILERIQKRDLYKCIWEEIDADSKNIPEDRKLRKWLTNCTQLKPYCNEENLLVINHKFDYGMKDKNPLENIYFYKKKTDTGVKMSKEEMPPTLPRKLQLRSIRIYTRCKVLPKTLLKVKAEVNNIISGYLKDQRTPDKPSGSSHLPRQEKRKHESRDIQSSDAKRSLKM